MNGVDWLNQLPAIPASGSLALPYRIIITTLAVGLWLAIFFAVKQLKVAPQRRINMISPVDRRLPFVPQMAWVYFSTYIFVLLPFLVLSEARLFWGILAGYLAVTVISTLFHVLLPSQVERNNNLAPYGVCGKLLGLFQQISKPHDNFPSMHVAFSVLVVGVAFTQAGPAVGLLMLAWAVLIALSTMFTKQHYLADVLAGTLNGSLIFGLTFWLLLA